MKLREPVTGRIIPWLSVLLGPLLLVTPIQGNPNEGKYWKDCQLVQADVKQITATWVCVNKQDKHHYEITLKRID